MRIVKLFIYVLLLSLFKETEGQILTNQIDSVVYGDYGGNPSTQERQKVAKLCADYIKKYYHQKQIPLIYLDITDKKDSTDIAELSYDNLYGNALENETYDRSGKYYKPGVRIKLHGSGYNHKAILKLLDYGINNLKTLKKERDRAAQLDYYDRPKTPTLSTHKINKILRKRANRKIKAFLSAND